MAVSDKAKNEGTFLDKIICKNKIKDVEKFGLNDVKYLKSLLDVPSVKLWMKSSRNQSEMKESYKKLYKDVCKYLDSMKKSCLAMKRYKPDELAPKVEWCRELKAKMEVEMGEILTKDMKEAKIPVNVKAIKKIDELTIAFNNFRASSCYKAIMSGAKVNPRLETYSEFEPRMRMKLGTNMPLIMVKEFVEEKKQLKEKETHAMFDYFVKSSNKFVKSARATVIKDLNKLAKRVELSESSLNKYLSSEKDFKEISNGLYNELAENLTKLVEETISEYNENFGGNKLEFTNEEELKNSIEMIMGGDKAVLEKEMKKKAEDNGNAEGWLSLGFKYFKAFYSGIYKVFEKETKSKSKELLYDSFKKYINWEGIKKEAKGSAEKYLKFITEDFLAVWGNFEVSHRCLVEIMNDRDSKANSLSELIGKYNKYIEDISKATEKMAVENKDKIKGVNIKNQDRFKWLVEEFNNSNNDIKKTIPKIKHYYDAAFDSAECVKSSIEVYINDYKGQFSKSFEGKTLRSWAPNKNSSKLTLGQAILFTHYCISKYEEKCFGLGKGFASYLEESERMKLGVTSKELKNIIANS